MTNILYLCETVCLETLSLLKVHVQGLKLWIFLLRDWLSSFRFSTLLWNIMIYDQEAKIEAQSSLYPDALCSIVYKENVFCSLACPV